MDGGAKSELKFHKYYFIGLAIILLFPYEAHFRPQNSRNDPSHHGGNFHSSRNPNPTFNGFHP